MKVTVEKEQAKELAKFETDIRQTEYKLATLTTERNELLNAILQASGAQLPKGSQISAPPDWSEILIIENGEAQTA